MFRSFRVPVTVRWGVALAFATALISGFSIWINASAVKQLPDPAVFTTLKNGVAAIVLVLIATSAVRRADVQAIDRGGWARLGLIGVIGGSIPFILFFTGLAQASAPSAAFIQKTLFVWVALLAVPFLAERLGWIQLAALAVLLGGQVLVAPPAGIRWGAGETMIAIATLFWAVEVILVKRVLGSISSPIVAAARLGIGMIVLVGYLAVAGKLGSLGALSASQWLWGLGTGLILSAYVATWFAALRRAPATVVSAILVVGAPVTALLQTLAAGTVPSGPALAGQALIAVAAVVLAAQLVRSARRQLSASAT